MLMNENEEMMSSYPSDLSHIMEKQLEMEVNIPLSSVTDDFLIGASSKRRLSPPRDAPLGFWIHYFPDATTRNILFEK